MATAPPVVADAGCPMSMPELLNAIVDGATTPGTGITSPSWTQLIPSPDVKKVQRAVKTSTSARIQASVPTPYPTPALD